VISRAARLTSGLALILLLEKADMFAGARMQRAVPAIIEEVVEVILHVGNGIRLNTVGLLAQHDGRYPIKRKK
jgi:hypothetical protein